MEKMFAAQRAAQGQQSGAEDDGAKAPIPTNMPSDFKLRPVPELEAAHLILEVGDVSLRFPDKLT